MRWSSRLLFLFFLLHACSASRAVGSNCDRDSTGMTPLNDLGPGLYQGFEGGLYPGGLNTMPQGHATSGLSIANAITPLDTLGAPDPANGKVVLLSIGMSNTSIEFSAFIPRANADPLKSSAVLVVNG